MTEYDRDNIQNFITKYKYNDDLNQAYLEFNLNWLNSFNNYSKINVLNDFDCVRDERIYTYSIDVLKNFITSLELMLKETY